MASQILAYPMVQNNGNSLDEWEPFHWRVIKDIRNMVMQHGFTSHFAQSVLQGIFTNDLTPLIVCR